MARQTFDEWEPTPIDTTREIATRYLQLPGNAPEIVESLLGANPDLRAGEVEEIFKPDAETVEVVYYNDAEAEVQGEDYNGKKQWDVTGTMVGDGVRQRLESLLQTYYGPAWLVRWKPDKRDDRSISRQRMWIRRVTHTEFRYADEEYAEARKIIEGVEADADEFGEMGLYPEPPDAISHEQVYGGDDDSPPVKYPTDIYVAQSGTGTCHLIQGRHLRSTAVVDDVTCLCGRPVPAADVRAGDVYHFADYVTRFTDHSFPDDVDPVEHVDLEIDNYDGSSVLDPVQVLREDLCGSCMKDYCDVTRSEWSDKIRHYKPPKPVNFLALTHWDDGRVDELDWVAIASERQTEQYLGGGVR